MLIIEFSKNWNGKLYNDCFTTVRLHNPRKYRVGQIYLIKAKGKSAPPEFCARAVDIKVLPIAKLNNWIAHLDSGMDKHRFQGMLKRMYGKHHPNIENARFDFILLKKN